jgi:MoaA/NifB/PqqE/SkfB family radical SAM enzyme
MWHITDICPLKCEYCFSLKTNRSFDINQIDEAVCRLGALQVQKIDIAGGEPLGSPLLQPIVNAIVNAGLYCTLTTSGVGRRHNINFLLDNISGFTRLIVSIDEFGLAHDAIRNHAGSWDAAISLIENISQPERRGHLRVNTVVTRPLLQSNGLTKLASVLSNLAVREWCLIQPHPANKKPNYGMYEITKLEFENAVALAQKVSDSSLKILCRPNNLYSNYWVLHPSGLLQKHSETEIDEHGVPLLETSMPDLIDFVDSLPVSVPTKE